MQEDKYKHTNDFRICFAVELCKLLCKTKTKNVMFLTCEWKMKGYCFSDVT